ncbi:MAG: zinc metalloprotease HtpX [Candidatus Omnitrophica bacterium]|jgi:heat shock protein HtpX|nr:zinc metalloprotease HtpX [Candidatus Omnitrophota bacterium]
MGAKFKSVFLLGVLSVLLIWIGSYWGENGIIIAFVFALAMNAFSYFKGDKLVLKMSHAREVSEKEAPDLYHLVGEVVSVAGLPMPKIYIIPNDSPNAFATGRDPQHASIAFTHGILDLLNKDELKGVIGHELSHVKNRDILIATIAATIASAISMIGFMVRWGAIFGGLGGRNEDENIVSLVVLGILLPLSATMIQLAISRNREYLADETGAKFCGNPLFLANALRKISRGIAREPMNNANPATTHLYIMNPFTKKSMLSLFATHPPTEERIKRLESMAFM